MAIVVKGDRQLRRAIRKLDNPEKILDPAFKATTRSSLRDLIKDTPRKTGNTARAWSTPKRIGNSLYIISNDVLTPDKQHALVDILNKGRGPVFPKRAKRIYIPLTEAGRAKKIGGPITSNLKFGRDYILVDSAGPYAGTKFLDKAVKQGGRELKKNIINLIRKLKRG